MYEVELADQQDSLEIDEERIREVVSRVLQEEEVAGAEISVAIVDNPTMRELNKQYLQHDYDTDVLSFLLSSEGGDDSEPLPTLRGRGKTIDGQLIVSSDMAIDMAKRYRWKSHDELILYIVHGLLHLVGFDDLTTPEKTLMRSRERQLLNLWDLSPHYDEDSQATPSSPDADQSTGVTE